MAKVLVEVLVQHVESPYSDWECTVVEVDASSRQEVSKSLDKIDKFFAKNCLGDFPQQWTTGELRILTAKQAKGRQVDEQLVLRRGRVSR